MYLCVCECECLWRLEEGVKSLELHVVFSGFSVGVGNPISDPLEEQQVL